MDGVIALPRKLFGHRYDHAIARLRQGHARLGALGLILVDLVDVRAGLRVGDIAERAGRITDVSQIPLGKGKHAIRFTVLVKRHRGIVSRRAQNEAESIVIGPIAALQNLAHVKRTAAIERAARTIGVGELSLRLRTSSDRSRRS